MKWHRMMALVFRHLYMYRRSPMRLVEFVYWPLLDLLVWGFVSVYLQTAQTGVPRVATFFLGALILWDLLFRAQQGISIAYLEEVWSRNLLNLFVSPLTVADYLGATMLVSIGKLAVSVSVMSLMALWFYDFNVLVLGISLAPFMLNLLLMGWALGIVTTGLILRFGQGAESLAWAVAFFFQPISAVFYPVAVLPRWLQPLALSLPSTHVFEGMRSVIAGNGVPWGHLAWAFGLNAVYMGASIGFFYYVFAQVRALGLLAKTGE